MTPIITTQRPAARLPDTTIGAEFVFDEQPLWRWAVLRVKESRTDPALTMLEVSAMFGAHVNALIAKAREGGPALLAAWHRDRRHGVVGGKVAPDAET